MTQGGLVEREIGFFHALREAGVSISLAEVIDATRALGVVDLGQREALRAAYAATVLKRPAHRPAFDALFDLWFPPALGAGSSDVDVPRIDDESGEGTVPIRLNGRMIARTLPMMFSSGTVPWNSSPMWKRESAELPRLSPITQ